MPKAEVREVICATVIKRLREERERQGISMTMLAARAGLNQATISLVERGMRSPTLDTLLRIAEVLQVELGQIVTQAARQTPGAKNSRASGL